MALYRSKLKIYVDFLPLTSSVVHLFCLLHLPSLPQSVCEVRGWSDVTEVRCFLPSFEDDCKDGERNSEKNKACVSVEVGRFTREATITGSTYRLTSGSCSGNGSSLSKPSAAATNPKCRANTSFSESCFPRSPTTWPSVCQFATRLTDQTELCLFKRSLQSIFTQRAALVSQEF